MNRLTCAALTLLLALPACIGQECNLMYAPDNLAISFSPALEDEGLWGFTLSGDLSATCSAPLPMVESVAPLCDNDLVSVSYSADGAAIEGISIFGEAPAAVTLSVSFDEASVGDFDLAPEYSVDEPNGKGCGERSAGEVAVEVP